MTEPAVTQPAVLVRLRPLGPWRFGTGEGGDHRLDTLFRSDRLYSAVTLAMEQLGFLDEWLDATARAASPAVTFSSLFPFQGDTFFAPPPATSWPPPAAQVTSPSPVFVAKMRWEAVRFIPLGLIEALITGQPVLADQWAIDAESGCLLRRDRPSQSPFRFSSRPRVAVDRLTSVSQQADHAACVEFENGSGLWLTVRFESTEFASLWGDRIRAAFRLLADTGFGGRRAAGWGQTAEPEWQTGTWPTLLMPKLGRKTADEEGQSSLYWLLSLYAPANSDQVNWKAGDYRLIVRGGRVQSRAGSGAVKKVVRMVTEGSVVSLSHAPVGAAVDVAPDGFPHPVYRSGLALALRLPVLRETTSEPAETTPSEGVVEDNRERESETPIPPAVHSDLSDEDAPVTEAHAAPESEHTQLAEMQGADATALPATLSDIAHLDQPLTDSQVTSEPAQVPEPEVVPAVTPATEPELAAEHAHIADPQGDENSVPPAFESGPTDLTPAPAPEPEMFAPMTPASEPEMAAEQSAMPEQAEDSERTSEAHDAEADSETAEAHESIPDSELISPSDEQLTSELPATSKPKSEEPKSQEESERSDHEV